VNINITKTKPYKEILTITSTMENTTAVPPSADEKLVVEEVVESEKLGAYTGQCKWFNDKLGYGFITICNGDMKGKDIFVHHSGIRPSNSNYKTLKKGEYIQFNVIYGVNGPQAVDITGIQGGRLMCDFVVNKKPFELGVTPPPPPPRTEWQTIQRRGPTKPTVFNAATVKRVKNVNKYNKATRGLPASV